MLVEKGQLHWYFIGVPSTDTLLEVSIGQERVREFLTVYDNQWQSRRISWLWFLWFGPQPESLGGTFSNPWTTKSLTNSITLAIIPSNSKFEQVDSRIQSHFQNSQRNRLNDSSLWHISLDICTFVAFLKQKQNNKQGLGEKRTFAEKFGVIWLIVKFSTFQHDLSNKLFNIFVPLNLAFVLIWRLFVSGR